MCGTTCSYASIGKESNEIATQDSRKSVGKQFAKAPGDQISKGTFVLISKDTGRSPKGDPAGSMRWIYLSHLPQYLQKNPIRNFAVFLGD